MVASTPPSASSGHSARVRLELYIGAARYSLSQIGPDRLIFGEPVVLPGTTGEVLALIDDQPRRWVATWLPSDSPREIVPAEVRDPA
jgi:hypothetical protein